MPAVPFDAIARELSADGTIKGGTISVAAGGNLVSSRGRLDGVTVNGDISVDGSLLINGWMPLDELRDLTGIEVADANQSHTAAGFVVQGFGRLPEAGDHFDAQGWRFEVLDMDGRRVDKILADKLSRRRAR